MDENKQQNPISKAVDTARTNAAITAIRDYIYQQKPLTFLSSDLVEDIPGFQSLGRAFADIVPTSTVLESDPEKRKQQIDTAIQKVNDAKHQKSILSDIAGNAATFGAASVPITSGFTVGSHALDWDKKPGHHLPSNVRLRSPFRKGLSAKLRANLPYGAVNAALYGATAPLLSSVFHPHRHNIEQAAKILQDQPALSSYPGSSMGLIPEHDKSDPNVLERATGGAGVGAGFALASQAQHGLTESILQRRIGALREAFHPHHLKTPLVGFPLVFGGAAGLSSLIQPGVEKEALFENPNASSPLFGEDTRQALQDKPVLFNARSYNNVTSQYSPELRRHIPTTSLKEKALASLLTATSGGTMANPHMTEDRPGLMMNMSQGDLPRLRQMSSYTPTEQSSRTHSGKAIDMELFGQHLPQSEKLDAFLRRVGLNIRNAGEFRRLGQALKTHYGDNYFVKNVDTAASDVNKDTLFHSSNLDDFTYDQFLKNRYMVQKGIDDIKKPNPLKGEIFHKGNKEYRVHVVNGKVVPFATYNKNSVLNFAPSLRTPHIQNVENYVQNLVDTIPEHQARARQGNYAFDIALDHQNNPRLIESNHNAVSGWMNNPFTADAVVSKVRGHTPKFVLGRRAGAIGGVAGLLGLGALGARRVLQRAYKSPHATQPGLSSRIALPLAAGAGLTQFMRQQNKSAGVEKRSWLDPHLLHAVMPALSGLGAAGVGLAKTVGVGKALNSGSSYLMRSNPYTAPMFKPFYRGMSQLGWRAGLDPSKELLPNWRKTIGTLFPTQSGVMDYEFSKQLAREAKSKAPAQYQGQLSQTSQLPQTNTDQIKSPLVRNFSEATQSPVPSWLDRLPKGPDQSGYLPWLRGVGLRTGFNAAVDPVSSIADHLINPHDTILGALYSNDKLNTLTNFKAKVMSLGQRPQMQQLNKVLQPAAQLYDPAIGEFYQAGMDRVNNSTALANTPAAPLDRAAAQHIDEEASHPILNSLKSDILGEPQS